MTDNGRATRQDQSHLRAERREPRLLERRQRGRAFAFDGVADRALQGLRLDLPLHEIIRRARFHRGVVGILVARARDQNHRGLGAGAPGPPATIPRRHARPAGNPPDRCPDGFSAWRLRPSSNVRAHSMVYAPPGCPSRDRA